MATKFVNFQAANYVPDWAALAKDVNFQGRFNQPPAMSDANATAMLATLGLTAADPTAKLPCLPPGSFSPRKLKFSFASGGSLAVPVLNRANLISIATTLKANLATYLGTQVVCIELIGEEWKRLDEELRPAGVTPTPGPDIRPTTGTVNPTFSVSMSYSSDGGKTVAQSVRMNSDQAGNLPFSGYSLEIVGTLGATLPKGCGGGSNIKPRRFEIDFLTTSPANPVRQLIIPVASETAANINAAGVGIATKPQTLCLRYFGESDGRFSRLIA